MTDTKRPLSFWGWGYADRFPDVDARRGVGAQVGALLGHTGAPEPKTPPTLSGLTLPPSRVELPESLRSIVTRDPAVRAAHTYGKSYRDIVRGFSGDFSAAPDLVAEPQTEADVQALLDACHDEQVAFVPFGGGTSVVGGVTAPREGNYRGVLSVDLRGLDAVLEVDPVSRAARIQAGATGPRIAEQLAPHGLSLRHYPQSYEFSTLGGWIATRAGGHFATLYTHIDDRVEGTRMLTPSGVFESRRLPGSGAGPSPDRLVLGSEGALGVITEAWLTLEATPRWRAKASVRFKDYEQAVHATRTLAQSGLNPANARLLDSREAMINGVAFDQSSVLLIGFESADHPLDVWLNRALEIARSFGGDVDEASVRIEDRQAARDTHDGDHARWRGAFIDMPYLLNSLVSMDFIADTFETACTWDRFHAMHRAIIHAVRGAMKRVCGGGLISCRFTHVYPDGPAPYYTFIAPGRAGSLLEQHAEIKAAASDALIEHGGTITHHHAVGRMHKPWYAKQRPAPFQDVLRSIKKTLDPQSLLNPGVLFDL